MSQTCQERLWRKKFDTCPCQLNGQRQPIQVNTNLGDGTSIGGIHLEVGLDRLRTFEEEGYRCILCERFALWKLREVGQRQWQHGKLVFTTDVQHDATGHQNLEVRTGGQQVR